jgi:3-hydroxybutyryl-CoA dehydratase
MSELQAPSLTVGDMVCGEFRVISTNRVRWYGDGLVTAATGTLSKISSNIHTDADYAREQGLEEPIADGMLGTNWISSLLLTTFGPNYLMSGRLRTKFIKPVQVGLAARPVLQLRRCLETASVVSYEMDVWVEDSAGAKLTVGESSVGVRVAPEG